MKKRFKKTFEDLQSIPIILLPWLRVSKTVGVALASPILLLSTSPTRQPHETKIDINHCQNVYLYNAWCTFQNFDITTLL